MKLQENAFREREAAVDQILDRPSMESSPKEHKMNPAETNARVQVDMGGVRRVVRFTNVRKFEFNLDTGVDAPHPVQTGTSQKIAKAILRLEGEVDLGAAACLDNDSFGYFVSVNRDGSFSVSRARIEQTLANQSTVVLEEDVGSGQSVKNELWNELYYAIHGDFMELPQSNWEREEEADLDEY